MAKGWRWLLVIMLMLTVLAAVLLALHLRSGGKFTLGGFNLGGGEPLPPVVVGGGKMEAHLFFSTPDGASLAVERRDIPNGEDVPARCRIIIDELKKGPREGMSPLLPVELDLRTLFLNEKLLVIDLDPRIKVSTAGVTQEALIWYSIVNSITASLPEVTSVRFLLDGQEADTILGHLDMRGEFNHTPEPAT
jgi:hypothetical protein